MTATIRNLYRSDCKQTLIYALTTLPTLPTCVISQDWTKLPASEAGGDFVELILLYTAMAGDSYSPMSAAR